MRIQVLYCPNCKSTLQVDTDKREFVYCPYCNSQLWLDNGKQEFTHNKNITYTKRIINEEKILKHKLKREKEKEDDKIFARLLIALAAVIVLSFGFLTWSEYDSNKKEQIAISSGKICAGAESDYTGKKYKAVVKELELIGFTNIETVDLQDSVLFFKKNNTVDSVKVNGRAISSSDYFDPDTLIVVSYH